MEKLQRRSKLTTVLILLSLILFSPGEAFNLVPKGHLYQRQIVLSHLKCKTRVFSLRIDRHEEIFGLINAFGRLAEHNAVGFNSRYVADMESPFSLWMPSKYSRRLKVDHPHWEYLFAGSDRVNREDFKERLSQAMFKYPVNDAGRPVVPCQKLTAQNPEVSIEGLQDKEDMRAKVNNIFQAEEIPEELLDRIFTGFLQQRRDKNNDEILLKDDFERLLLEWGRVGEGESDPVVDWEIFLDNLYMLEKEIPNRGVGYTV